MQKSILEADMRDKTSEQKMLVDSVKPTSLLPRSIIPSSLWQSGNTNGLAGKLQCNFTCLSALQIPQLHNIYKSSNCRERERYGHI